ncbi:hypothetical protein [Deinococcus hopiensis]|uniref:hypothetical protein n=1 Tax=Deinococcus hopiensis TaxID=309885 RepID=UPI00148384AB|nr:hypothetical protein [Deinococcus hopiensis]
MKRPFALTARRTLSLAVAQAQPTPAALAAAQTRVAWPSGSGTALSPRSPA